MDTLSNILSLLKLESYWSAAFDFGGDWSIALGPFDGIRFYAAVSGACWLLVDDIVDPVRVVEGDCLLLPRGRGFRIASDLALDPVDPFTIFQGPKDGGVRCYNGGGDFFCVGGQFALHGDYANVLLEMLPPIMHVRSEPDKAALRWYVERMRHELREPQPGGFLVAQQLAMMIFIAAIRLHLASGLRGGVGWLFALADKSMAAAINAMHDDPANRWTIQSLANRAGMSRTSFALKFKQTVGESPIEYLTRWRMLVAADKLLHSSDPVSAISPALGYQSEAAFSTAFKRVMGCSPRQYSRRASRSAVLERTVGVD